MRPLDEPHRGALLLMALLAAGAWGGQPPEAGVVAELTWACEGEGSAPKVAAACYRLGELYREGNGVDRSLERAIQLYQEACPASAPDARACLRLAELHTRGEGVPKDEERATGLYRRGCDAGLPEACAALASSRPQAPGSGSSAPKADAEKQLALAARASTCKLKKDADCREVLRLYVDEPFPVPQQVLAVMVLVVSTRCDGGSLPDCTVLGRVYLQLAQRLPDSEAVSKERERGLQLLKRACDGEEAEACAHLGVTYEEGSGGLVRDVLRARELLQRGCLGGALEGCSHLAMLQLQNTQEAERGLRLLVGGCELEHGPSCARLAQLYQEGKLVTRDELRALGLSDKACRQGYKGACTPAPGAEPTAALKPGKLLPETERRLEQLLLWLKPRYEEYQQASKAYAEVKSRINALEDKVNALAQAVKESAPQLKASLARQAELEERARPFFERSDSLNADDIEKVEALRQESLSVNAEIERLMRPQVLLKNTAKEVDELTRLQAAAAARLRSAAEKLEQP